MAGLFAYSHHVGKQIWKHFLLLQSGGERSAIDHRSPDLAKLDFEEAVAGNFRDTIKCAKKRNPVFHQGSQCARKLRVVTVTNNPPVSRNHQPETIPCDASFLSAH